MGPGWKRVLMPKPKTKAQLDRATDIRLQARYGVGLDWYYEQLDKQDGGCAICGSTPKSRKLHIDHDHSWTKVKADSRKMDDGWKSSAEYKGKVFRGEGHTKSEALRRVKAQLKRASVRALICFPHNKGLQVFRDDPSHLRAAAKYLENHQEAA
jgi:hypothetical protein